MDDGKNKIEDVAKRKGNFLAPKKQKNKSKLLQNFYQRKKKGGEMLSWIKKQFENVLRSFFMFY